MMQKDGKLKKVIKRVGERLERSSYRISYCAGLLGEVFDIVADSVYGPKLDAGIYVKVCIDTIPAGFVSAVLQYPTPRKKEICVMKFGDKNTDPGTLLFYRFEGARLVEQPRDWPLEKVNTSPQKRGVRSTKRGS